MSETNNVDFANRWVVLWRENPAAQRVSTHMLDGRVLALSGEEREVGDANKVVLFEEAQELLRPGNGRRVAVRLDVAAQLIPDVEFVGYWSNMDGEYGYEVYRREA
jgi:hypothetical protein